MGQNVDPILPVVTLVVSTLLANLYKKVSKKTTVFAKIVSELSRNPSKARGLSSDYRTSIVGAHWQRLPSFVQIGAVVVEN